ncbi:MAG: divalent-cation tolerance protein CutA [Candidatus Coatesbacteria bacterium]|nr:divalent-cation tolerance protein CutA [Candidatus Coatesbacteria bacterium]
MNNEIIIYCTFPDEESLKKITGLLLEKHLIACINYWKMKSSYWWKDRIEESDEITAVMKSVESNFNEIEKLFRKEHPYEVPALVYFRIDGGSASFLDWINMESSATQIPE